MYALKCSSTFLSHSFSHLRFLSPQTANFKMHHYYFTTYYVVLCAGIEKVYAKKYLALGKFIKCVGICTECQITKEQKSKV